MSAEILRALVLSAAASTAAILLVLLSRKPLRARFGVQAAYALWLLVPLAGITVLLPAPLRTASTAVLPALAHALPSIAAAPPEPVRIDPVPWLLAAWLCGAGISAISLVAQQRRFLRALGRLDPLGGALRAEGTAGCPALVGGWRPRIVLPADFEERYSAVERGLILAHERVHLARCDAQANLLAAALLCLNWFNPLFHFAASRFRFDQELACDAAVIAVFPEARRPYADAMLKTQLADIGLPAGCYWQSSHPLKERISMLKQPLPGRARRTLGLAVSALLVLGGSYAAWAMQPAQAAPASASNAATKGAGASYRKLHRIAYPAAALAAQKEGVVYVSAHVAADGSVADADVAPLGTKPDKLLAEAAVSGVRTWTFNPASKDGKPQASDEIIPIVFFLKPDAVPKVSGGTLEPIRIGAPEPEAKADTEVEYINSALNAPAYPPAARAARQTGKLVLKVHVDATGAPESAIVETAEPAQAREIFGSGAIATVMDWRFKPATHAGRPVDGYVLVPISYDLRDEAED